MSYSYNNLHEQLITQKILFMNYFRLFYLYF